MSTFLFLPDTTMDKSDVADLSKSLLTSFLVYCYYCIAHFSWTNCEFKVSIKTLPVSAARVALSHTFHCQHTSSNWLFCSSSSTGLRNLLLDTHTFQRLLLFSTRYYSYKFY